MPGILEEYSITVNTYIRVGGAVAIGVFLIGTAVFVSAQKVENTNSAAIVVATEPRAYQETKDTDQDGVPDWEESVSGTNPTIKDTSTTTQKKREEEAALNTVTDRFAKQFFSEYLSKNSGDTPMTPEEKQAFLEKAIQKAYTSQPIQSFTEKDIVRDTSTATDTLRAYGNAVADALQRYPVQNENEALIFKRAIESESEVEIGKLDPIILSYKNTIRDIRLIPVPTTMTSSHLALLNSLNNLQNTLTAMREALEDPLPALTQFQQYVPVVESLQDSLLGLKASFASQNVVFSQNERGHFFTDLQI